MFSQVQLQASMTEIAPSHTHILQESTFRRKESYIFSRFPAAKLSVPNEAVEREMVESFTPVYRWSNSETMAAPLLLLPPPPPPPPAPTKSALQRPPPPPTKSATPVSSALTITPKYTPSPSPVPTSLALVLRNNNSGSNNNSTPPPPPTAHSHPLFIPYESYEILTSPFPHPMIHVPLGSLIIHRGRKIPLTTEILSQLEGTKVPLHGLIDGIYVSQTKCEVGPPFPFPAVLERRRAYFSRDLVRVTIPPSVRNVDEKVNESERTVTIPPSACITVVTNGRAKLVPVDAVGKVDLGYSKAVNARVGYLEKLGVLGEKWAWVDEGDVEELDVVRSFKEVKRLKEEVDKERDEGKKKKKKKKVRYWAYGIDEDQIPKGQMKPLPWEVVRMEEMDERKAVLSDLLRWRRMAMMGLQWQVQSACKGLLGRVARTVRRWRVKSGLRPCKKRG